MLTLYETHLYHQCNIVVVGSTGIGRQGRMLRLMLWLNYLLEFHD